jgi:hypothetical protein
VSKFSKSSNLFEISTWYCSLTSALFNLEIDPLHMKHMRFLFSHCQSVPNFCHHQILVRTTVCSPELLDIKYTWMLPPVYQNMVNLTGSLPSGDIQVNLWMLRYGNIALLAVRVLDVATFTILTPLWLLISYKSLFPIIGLEMSSLSILALKS